MRWFGALAIAAAFYIDFILMETPLLAEGRPIFGGLYLLKTGFIAAGSALLAIAASQGMRAQDREADTEGPAWYSWGTLFWSMDGPADTTYSIPLKRVVLWVCAALSAFFVILFIVSPGYFSRLSREDMPVEIASALMLFFASVLFLYLAVCIYKKWSNHVVPGIVICCMFALIYFIVGMEEISWMQRIVGFETPDSFAQNMQDEANLHNFATNESENIYYFFSFLLLVVVPLVLKRFNFANLRVFIPSLYVSLFSLLFISYNFDMWNITFIQIAFFFPVFLFISYVYRNAFDFKLDILFVILLCILSQILFLYLGDGFRRLHDVTEYKEFFIPLAYVVYATDTLVRAKKIASRSPAVL